MAGPAVAVRNVGAAIDPAGLLEGRIVVDLRTAVVSITEEAARVGVPAGAPMTLERFGPDRIWVKTSLTPLGGVLELHPSVGETGNLQVTVVSMKAGGFLPVTGLVGGFMNVFRDKIAAAHPGIRVAGERTVEVDLNAAARPHLGVHDLTLP